MKIHTLYYIKTLYFWYNIIKICITYILII